MTDAIRPSLDGIPPRPGGPGRGGSARGQQESAAIRGARALEMRMAGATFTQIADRLGDSDPATARRAIQRALDRDLDLSSDPREEYRRLMLARIERLIRRWWVPAVSQDSEADSDKATGHVVKLMERQARLLGLDEPTRIAVTPMSHDRVTSLLDDLRGMHSEDVEKRDEEIARLEAMLAVTLDGDNPDGE